jgi:prolyl oligopeptidase
MLTRYPQPVRRAVCTMPVIDMRRYAKLLVGPAITDEYGDPNNPEDRKFLAGLPPVMSPRQATPIRRF